MRSIVFDYCKHGMTISDVDFLRNRVSPESIIPNLRECDNKDLDSVATAVFNADWTNWHNIYRNYNDCIYEYTGILYDCTDNDDNEYFKIYYPLICGKGSMTQTFTSTITGINIHSHPVYTAKNMYLNHWPSHLDINGLAVGCYAVLVCSAGVVIYGRLSDITLMPQHIHNIYTANLPDGVYIKRYPWHMLIVNDQVPNGISFRRHCAYDSYEDESSDIHDRYRIFLDSITDIMAYGSLVMMSYDYDKVIFDFDYDYNDIPYRN